MSRARSRISVTSASTFTLLACVGAVVLASLVPACSSSSDAGPSCTNGARDEGEDGIDCGGVCTSRCTGSGCTVADECASKKCENGACGAPDGKLCGVGTPTQCDVDGVCELDRDCKSSFCDKGKCAVPTAESHTDGKSNGGETGIDCGGSIKTTAPCPDGQRCVDSTDCVGTCTGAVCGPIGPMDGKKNNGETDTDCGGSTAPKCANGKACDANLDCLEDYCPAATKKCTAPTYTDGVMNGDETDVDCGGTTTKTGFKKCAAGLVCAKDTDCSAACAYTKKCIDIPSCKPHFGGDTCGPFVNGGEPSNALALDNCCSTLPVAGYADAAHPNMDVYLDKYEITAGRMRAFVDAVSAENGGVPNVKSFMATRRPAVGWNTGWEQILPQAFNSGSATFTVTNPTTDLLYPGQDRYLANAPTQTSWYVADGTFTAFTGLARTLGGPYQFPEYVTTNPPNGTWPATDYAVSHGYNCFTTDGSGGFPTYWFDQATIVATGSGTQARAYPQEELDKKALNCTTAGMFAAFCAWDGGQIATSGVFDAVTNSGALITDGNSPTGCAGGTLVTQSDAGSGGCFASGPYYYPPRGTQTHDGASRVAAPGRVPADVVSAGGQTWFDLKGNLVETVLLPSGIFGARGFGLGFGTAVHHRNQQTTPRNKGGSFGARCMRFKPKVP